MKRFKTYRQDLIEAPARLRKQHPDVDSRIIEMLEDALYSVWNDGNRLTWLNVTSQKMINKWLSWTIKAFKNDDRGHNIFHSFAYMTVVWEIYQKHSGDKKFPKIKPNKTTAEVIKTVVKKFYAKQKYKVPSGLTKGKDYEIVGSSKLGLTVIKLMSQYALKMFDVTKSWCITRESRYWNTYHEEGMNFYFLHSARDVGNKYERQCIQIRNGVKEYSWDINDVANEQFKSFFPDAFEIDIQNYVSSLNLSNFKNAEAEAEGEYLGMIHQLWLDFDQYYQTLKSKVNQKKLQQHVQEAIERDCNEKEAQREELHGNENQERRKKYFNDVRKLGISYYIGENSYGDDFLRRGMHYNINKRYNHLPYDYLRRGMHYIIAALKEVANIQYYSDINEEIPSDLMEYWQDHGFGNIKEIKKTIFLDLFGYPAEKTRKIKPYSDLEVNLIN